LKDADFVSTQFRVGLLDARIKDERIPLSHGLIGHKPFITYSYDVRWRASWCWF